MLFEDVTILLLWIACTYAIVQITFGLTDMFRKSTVELEEKLKKHLDNIIHRVKIEKHREVYYWFDMDNNKFLAQGSSDEEIISALKSRFPDHMFFLPTNHLISAKTDWQPKFVGDKL